MKKLPRLAGPNLMLRNFKVTTKTIIFDRINRIDKIIFWFIFNPVYPVYPVQIVFLSDLVKKLPPEAA